MAHRQCQHRCDSVNGDVSLVIVYHLVCVPLPVFEVRRSICLAVVAEKKELHVIARASTTILG